MIKIEIMDCDKESLDKIKQELNFKSDWEVVEELLLCYKKLMDILNLERGD